MLMLIAISPMPDLREIASRHQLGVYPVIGPCGSIASQRWDAHVTHRLAVGQAGWKIYFVGTEADVQFAVSKYGECACTCPDIIPSALPPTQAPAPSLPPVPRDVPDVQLPTPPDQNVPMAPPAAEPPLAVSPPATQSSSETRECAPIAYPYGENYPGETRSRFTTIPTSSSARRLIGVGNREIVNTPFPRELVFATIRAESGWSPTATGRLGECGLGQFMPRTFEWLRSQGVLTDCHDPTQAMRAVTWLLTHLWNARGIRDLCPEDRLDATIIAYGWGIGNWRQYGTTGQSRNDPRRRNRIRGIRSLMTRFHQYLEQTFGVETE
jgi:transglycosylase-like protein with SLT domain